MFAPIRPTPTNPILSAIIVLGLYLCQSLPNASLCVQFGNQFGGTLNKLYELGTLFSRKRLCHLHAAAPKLAAALLGRLMKLTPTHLCVSKRAATIQKMPRHYGAIGTGLAA